MSDTDDIQVGRILSRREVLASLGAAGAALVLPPRLARTPSPILLGGHRVPGCVVRPAQTEGPYFVATELDRSDIRSDPTDGLMAAGATLSLTIAVSRLDGTSCAAYGGVVVELWQCDALGIYSGVKDINGLFDTTGQRFLRGHQRTGSDGVVSFETIYPGFYGGRTPHIHFKVRTDPDQPRGGEFVSQLYFDDALSDRVYAHKPYADNRQARVRNAGDGIYRQGGKELMLAVTPAGAGYQARFEIGLVAGGTR